MASSSISESSRRCAILLSGLMMTSALATIPVAGAEDVTVPFTPLASVYAEDFELGDGGWTSGGTASTWALGTPTAGPAGAWSGLNAWGTNLAGNYNNNECSWIQSPAIALPGAGMDLGGTVSAARLGFKHWLVSENRYDGAVVQVSTNGGANWTIVAPPGGYPVDLLTSARRCVLGTTETTPPPQRGWSGTMSNTTTAWLDAEVDLTAYLGQTLQVRLVFGTDSSVVKHGWYVDDVLVQVGVGAFASVEPPAMEDVSAFQPVTTLYAEDFELGDGGWAATGAVRSWAFGTPTYGPSGPFSGANVWATNLGGNYSASECSRLVSAPIALPGVGAELPEGVSLSAARLYFKQWFVSESRYDGGLLQISTDDGGNWTTLAMPSYLNTANTAARGCLGLTTEDVFQTGTLSTKPDEWLDGEADLTPYLGQTVRLGFAFASDGIVHRAGWYLDDVAVVAGVGATVAPPSVEPSVDVPYVPVFTAYEQGFEDGLGDWTTEQMKIDTRQYRDPWAHGVPAYASGPAAVSGKVWGTNLTGNYNNNDCAALTSPTLSVPAGTNVSLTWRQWVKTESAYDGGVLEVSNDGGATWGIVNPWGGYPRALNTAARQCIHGVFSSSPPLQSGWSGTLSSGSTSWLNGGANLAAYAGQDVVLRYHWGTDGSVNSYAGWYLDNVTLTVDGTASAFFDFESGPQGWSAAATPIPKPLSWEAGAPANVGPAAAAAGTGVLGTNVDGNYADGECNAVLSPPIDLTGYPAELVARMTTSEWFDSAGSGDGGLWQMRIDGGNWTVLLPEGGYPSTITSSVYGCVGVPSSTKGYSGALSANATTWFDAMYPLVNASGHVVELRAVFGSDTSTTDAGWYVDDLVVTVGAGGTTVGLPALPAFAPSVTPDDRLVEALSGAGAHGNDKFLEVVVGGPALAQPPMAPDRVGLMAYYEAQSADFLAAVGAYAVESGGEVLASFAAAPAVVVRVPRDAVMGLGEIKGVERLTLDDGKSVSLVAPVEDERVTEDDFKVENEQSVPMTQAPDIWALGYRGEGIKLAVIDTGIDGSHEIVKDASCASRIAGWKDYIANVLTPYDDNGHGTHVTGTSAGSTACGGRADGVAPKATILGVKFLSSSGSGSFANGMASLQWAFDNGADVTSNSWGSTSCSASLDTLRLVNNLARGGMVSAFAAGNSGPSSGTIGGPGCADLVVTVGSTDKSMVVSSFSSRGPCSDPTEGGVSRVCPDVVAVGSGVVSSVPRGSCSLCNPTGYRMLNGTSMATPHVGGALVLMTQFKQALTGSGWDTANKAEETALRLTAIDLGVGGDDNTYGSGFIQLLPIYNLLANPGVPDVRDQFVVPTGDLRVGNTGAMSFRVSNAGTRAVDGHFTVTLTTPDGTEILADRNVTLGFGSATSHAMTLAVTGASAAGTYTYAGDFTYSWTDDDDVVHTGEVHRAGSFVVRKIDIRVTRAMPEVASLAMPFDVVLTIENRGNEDAVNVSIAETVRDAYKFVPGAPDPFNANWVYGGTPAPSEVARDDRFGRTTLTWMPGDMPAGSNATISYSVIPTQTGTFPFIGVAKYRNAVGQAFLQGSTTPQTVTATPELDPGLGFALGLGL